jgi:hypothetical protein
MKHFMQRAIRPVSSAEILFLLAIAILPGRPRLPAIPTASPNGRTR